MPDQIALKQNKPRITRGPRAYKQAMPARLIPSDDEAVTLFLAHLASAKKSPATIKAYRGLLARVGDAIYPTPLMKATPGDLLTWQRTVAANTPGSIAGNISSLRSFYRWTIRPMHWLDTNPAEELASPRIPISKPRPVPEAAIHKAIIHCPDQRMRMWLALMRYAGLRCCEIAWMCRDWVIDDPTDPRLHVVGKGSRERIVSVDAELILLLEPWMSRQGHLFLSAYGRPFTPRYVSETVNEFLHDQSLPYTAHQLRHSFGSRALETALDLRVVQEMMGHSSPSTTAVYTEVNKPLARKVATTNGALLHELEIRRRRR